MSVSSMNRRLLWKETRQVLPLTVSLVTIAFVLGTWFAYMSYGGFLDNILHSWQTMSILPPILFAIGAGTVLVGQEKESRSLNWLITLPVSPRYVIRHQFIFGLTGLLIMWLGCLVVIVLTDASRELLTQSSFTDFGWVHFFVVLNSLYLLVCGFTTAWMSRTSLHGLLSVIVLAVLPYLAAYAINWVYHVFWGFRYGYYRDPSEWLTLQVLVLFIIGVGAYGYRTAHQQLSGQSSAPPSARKQSFVSSLQAVSSATQNFFRGDSQLKQAPPTAMTSLLWQFRNQNRGSVILLYSAFFVSFPLAWGQLQNRYPNHSNNAILATTCVVISFGTLCWMAALAFQGERTHNRVRFLAEHGISPTRVWLTRHAVPFVFFCLYVSIWASSLRWENSSANIGYRLINQGLTLSTSEIALGCATIYAISQWLSQMIKPVAICSVAVTIVSFYVSTATFWQIKELETPWVLIVIGFVLVPLFATWRLMPRWMDGRFGWQYWLSHASFAGLAILLPIVPFGAWYLNAPKPFTPQEIDALLAERQSIRANSLPRISVIQLSEEDYKDYEDIAGPKEKLARREAETNLAARRRDRLVALSNAVGTPNTTVIGNEWEIRNFVGDLTWLRLALDVMNVDDGDRESILREYREYLQAFTKLVAALRPSSELKDQEFADKIEIWLLAELAKPETRARLDDVTFAAIVNQVSQSEQRWEARRRAFIASAAVLLDSKTKDPPPDIFGWYRPTKDAKNKDTVRGRLQTKRETVRLIRTVLAYIDDAKAGHVVYPREQLIAYWGGPEAYFGAGLLGPYMRFDDVTKAGTIIFDYREPTLTQWGAGWEQTGREWAMKMDQLKAGEKAK